MTDKKLTFYRHLWTIRNGRNRISFEYEELSDILAQLQEGHKRRKEIIREEIAILEKELNDG